MRGKAKAREAYANRKAHERGERLVNGANAIWIIWAVEQYDKEDKVWRLAQACETRREARNVLYWNKKLEDKTAKFRVKKYIRLEAAWHLVNKD